MKVTVIKGPLFEESKARAQKLLYEILMGKIEEERNQRLSSDFGKNTFKNQE